MRLPSGPSVRLRSSATGEPIADDTVGGERAFAGRLFRAIEQGRLTVEQGGRAMGPEELLDLPLRDLHALRDAAERLAVIAAEPAPERCRNCDAVFEPDPSTAPIDDLDEWYEDDPGYYVAVLMHRTFGIDALACPRCGGRLRLIATILSSRVAIQILRHLGLPAAPSTPTRPRPTGHRRHRVRRQRVVARQQHAVQTRASGGPPTTRHRQRCSAPPRRPH